MAISWLVFCPQISANAFYPRLLAKMPPAAPSPLPQAYAIAPVLGPTQCFSPACSLPPMTVSRFRGLRGEYQLLSSNNPHRLVIERRLMHMGTFQFCWINGLQLYYRIFIVYILTNILVFRSRMEVRGIQDLIWYVYLFSRRDPLYYCVGFNVAIIKFFCYLSSNESNHNVKFDK